MPAIVSSVLAESLLFVENGAGTYTGSIIIPAGGTLIDVIVHAEALWASGTSAVLIVGDATDDDGIYAATDLKATDLLAGEAMSIALPGLRIGADNIGVSTASSGGQFNRRSLTAERAIVAKIVSVGVGATGRTRVTVVFAPLYQSVITK